MVEKNEIRLHYFDIIGLGEAIRLTFYIGDVPFEDIRVNRSTWASVKPNYKYGQLPVLEYKGQVFAQAKAIGNFAARMAGIFPTDNLDILKHDEAINLRDDINLKAREWRSEEDPVKKKAIAKRLAETDFNFTYSHINKLLEKSQSGYFVGNSITHADLVWYAFTKGLKQGQPVPVHENFFNVFPHVQTNYSLVHNHPRVREWNAKHQQVPDIKLTYFNIKGLAEPIRLAFTIANVPFVDNRIEFSEWPGVKPTTKFGQVPQLEFQGQVYAQSRAIGNFAAKKAGLYPNLNNDVETLIYDEAMSLRDDLNGKSQFIWSESPTKQEQIVNFRDKVLPEFLGYAEKCLEKNNTGFFVGSALTYADIYWYTQLYFYREHTFWAGSIPNNYLEKYIRLNALYDTIHNNPKVKQWNLTHV